MDNTHMHTEVKKTFNEKRERNAQSLLLVRYLSNAVSVGKKANSCHTLVMHLQNSITLTIDTVSNTFVFFFPNGYYGNIPSDPVNL